PNPEGQQPASRRIHALEELVIRDPQSKLRKRQRIIRTMSRDHRLKHLANRATFDPRNSQLIRHRDSPRSHLQISVATDAAQFVAEFVRIPRLGCANPNSHEFGYSRRTCAILSRSDSTFYSRNGSESVIATGAKRISGHQAARSGGIR